MRMLPTSDKESVRKLNEKRRDLLGQQQVRDLVEAAFGCDRRAVLSEQGRPDGNIGGHHIFVEQFAQDDYAFSPLHRVHVHNAYVRRFHVLRAPVDLPRPGRSHPSAGNSR